MLLRSHGTGGVVGHGESYEDNARRELEEEMGVKATPGKGGGGGSGSGRADGELRHCFSFHYKDNHTNVWGDAWDCVWGGEIVPQPVRRVGSIWRGGWIWWVDFVHLDL